MRKINHAGEKPPPLPYVVVNDDGTTRLQLPDLPAVAMYITRTDSTPRVLHADCQLWPVWHGRKERHHATQRLDDVLNEMRRRVDAMRRANVCRPSARWHYESNLYNDCHPKGWTP